MKRRTFLVHGTIIAGGLRFQKFLSNTGITHLPAKSLHNSFNNPETSFRPFVRWWWNGDKIEKPELKRELELLKHAGIGGVEIYPIKFPAKTNDLGKRAVEWLGDEWLDLLGYALEQAKALGMTCDLLAGSGWPFGGDWVQDDERSEIVVLGTTVLDGPMEYEVPVSELMEEAVPVIYSPFDKAKMEILSAKLLSSLVNGFEDVTDVSDKISGDYFKCKIPDGRHVLYVLVKISGFMRVIQGAPGADGPVLNHYNDGAVKKYLSRISSALNKKPRSMFPHIHALFVDSLELEGANWCQDMQYEFKKRRGYDLLPWLPFVLYKIAAMGNTFVFDYGVTFGDNFKGAVQRVRFDFELTKAELLRQRFLNPVISWCKENSVLSRVQAYGRGYFPLEGSFNVDIPECETWIRPGLGEEMSESDYRIGRAYTVVNKFVSSAAHLKGKKHVSCEELTNIHMVFNESLELMKIASDQSIISGVTHSILHGFNYSPPGSVFPGWVSYGSFINERAPWWKWFQLFTEYKARISSVLQQATMFADIAILPPTSDLWSIFGAQNDPFPVAMHPEWQTRVWEAIHQNGNGCDYISERVIQGAEMKQGFLHYGPRKYRIIFLTQVETMEPATAKKLLEFVAKGGRIFCIESYPQKSSGWKDNMARDRELNEWIDKLKSFPTQFAVLKSPTDDFTGWFKTVQQQFGISPYVFLDKPNPFVTQVWYRTRDMEMFVLTNSNMNKGYEITITPETDIISGKQAWLWDPHTGERFRLTPQHGSLKLDMGPSDLKMIVFDREQKGPLYKPEKKDDPQMRQVTNSWSVTGNHVNGSVTKSEMSVLKDLKEISEWVNFCGHIVYRTNFELNSLHKIEWINLGKLWGVSEVLINGQIAGTRWYGRRIYPIKNLLRSGNNELEVRLTTTMGNYLKSMTNNSIAQFWTNQGRTVQPLQSMGLLGPVTIY